MTNELYLEKLLVRDNHYGKMGNLFSKEDYWFVEFTYCTIEGWVKHAADNKWTRFEVDEWQKLERTTLYDILQKNGFIV